MVYAAPKKSYDLVMKTNTICTSIILDFSVSFVPFSLYKKLDVNYNEQLFLSLLKNLPFIARTDVYRFALHL
jgi:hypothetical protein